jgi:hypothetical protein
MTLSRLYDVNGYFSNNPPTHLLVAAYLGYESPDRQSGKEFLSALAAQVKAQAQIKPNTNPA